MVYPQGTSSPRVSRRPESGGISVTPRLWLVVVVSAFPAFFLGTLSALYAGIECTSSLSNHVADSVIENRVKERVKDIEEKFKARQRSEIEQQVEERVKLVEARYAAEQMVPDCPANGTESVDLFPKEQFGHTIVDMARVDKEEFIKVVDPGVPVDRSQSGASEVLLLYSRVNARPKRYIDKGFGSQNPKIAMPEALENCEQVNVILADHSGQRRQCFAIVPQYESYHIQKWMRIDEQKRGKLDDSKDLQLVSRGHQKEGRDEFYPPSAQDVEKAWDLLQHFFESLDDVKRELDLLLKRIVKDNTVIIMVCNFGQSELLLNFACSARQRGFDLSNILVFATDRETLELSVGIGLNAYFDERNFGDVPTGAASRYGDRKFVAMMLAKTLVPQLVSMLGYDFLFQDVDIVWYKNPISYFNDPSNPMQKFGYDIFFQDDGGHSLRYAPYSANSGFYFVKNNLRTRHFLTTLLMSSDLVISTKSHQQVMIAVLQEHVSLHGLKVKVLSRDMEEFPGGYQYNQRSGQYMKDFFAGKVHPYIFHMSWTLNKDNKLLYFRQMGEWYVEDKCIQKKREQIVGKDSEEKDLQPFCCSSEPLISCHYRDKPSKIPCKDSPTIDKGRPSFW